MNSPKVSVIIPGYNTEKYLPTCVSSVRNQTLKDIEIILVDDESPDNAPALCDEYARQDKRIKVVHKKNGGLGLARNSGMEVASAKYVTFIDSDDYIDPTALEQLYLTSVSKDLDICYGSFCYDKLDGTKMPKPEVKEATFFIGREEVDNFTLDMVGPEPSFPREVKYSVSVCKAIFKLDVFRQNHLMFGSEKQVASEDFLFHLNLLSKVNKIGYLPICYYHYCENGESISHTYSDAKFKRIVLSMQEVKKRLSALFPVDRYMIHYQRCLYLSLRGVLVHECERNDVGTIAKLSIIGKRCSDPVYSDLYSNYPYWKLGLAKRVLYLGMRYRLPLLIFFILYTKKRLHK